jgi:phospholipase/lecithinase/hemolysin
MRNLKLLSFCLALLLVRATYANQRLVVFGDSLSDNGRLFAITGSPPVPYGDAYNSLGKVVKYFPGRFTDGQNWVDYFPKVARFFGVEVSTVSPFLEGPLKASDDTTNFAVGGATSGDFNVNNPQNSQVTFPGFETQISAYLGAVDGHASADDLYVIWIGANDFAANISPQTTVANVRGGITALAQAGAKHIVVINVPNIALTPEVKALPAPEIWAAIQFVAAVNGLLAVYISISAWTERINVDLVDINTIFVPVVLEPFFFGFSNSSGPPLIRPPGGQYPIRMITSSGMDFIPLPTYTALPRILSLKLCFRDTFSNSFVIPRFLVIS